MYPIMKRHASGKFSMSMIRWDIYCAWPETALSAKCEDRACQGTIAEKSAILPDVEYSSIAWLG